MKKYLLFLAAGSFVCCATTEESKRFSASKGDLTQKTLAESKKGAKENPHTSVIEVQGETDLMRAAKKGNTKLMKELIDAGADVNAVYGSDFPHAGSPVLRYAIDGGSRDAVRMLIKAGANVNDVTENGIHHSRSKANRRNVPLISSAIKSRKPIEIIEELIASGADVNQQAMHGGWTPLMIAAYTGYTDAVKKLLVAGADKTVRFVADGGRTAIDYADEQGNKEIVDLLQDANYRPSRWKRFKGRLGW